MTITKRTLLKSVGALSIGAAISSLDPVEAATKSLEQAPVVGIKRVSAAQADKHTAKVYFTRKIDAEHLIKLYHLVNHDIDRKSTRLNSSHPTTSRMPSSA